MITIYFVALTFRVNLNVRVLNFKLVIFEYVSRDQVVVDAKAYWWRVKLDVCMKIVCKLRIHKIEKVTTIATGLILIGCIEIPVMIDCLWWWLSNNMQQNARFVKQRCKTLFTEICFLVPFWLAWCLYYLHQ